jgi:hypothetical protein
VANTIFSIFKIKQTVAVYHHSVAAPVWINAYIYDYDHSLEYTIATPGVAHIFSAKECQVNGAPDAGYHNFWEPQLWVVYMIIILRRCSPPSCFHGDGFIIRSIIRR